MPVLVDNCLWGIVVRSSGFWLVWVFLGPLDCQALESPSLVYGGKSLKGWSGLAPV